MKKNGIILLLALGHGLNDLVAGYFLGCLVQMKGDILQVGLGLFIYNLLAFGGQYPVALWLEKFALGPAGDGLHGWAPWYWYAAALAVLGKHEQAITALETSAKYSNLAWLPYLKDGACFRSLHSDPRYQIAIQKLEARHEELRQRLPQTLASHGLSNQRTLSQPHRGASTQ